MADVLIAIGLNKAPDRHWEFWTVSSIPAEPGVRPGVLRTSEAWSVTYKCGNFYLMATVGHQADMQRGTGVVSQ